MKKIILCAATVTVLLTIFTSCKKDVVKIPTTVIPPKPTIESGSVEQFLTSKRLISKLYSEPLEIGVTFKSSDSGYIKSLKLNLPIVGNYSLTLRKVDDNSIVAIKTITTINPDSWRDSIAVNIPIEANTEYTLSTFSTSYYIFSFPIASLPFTNESISLISFNSYDPTRESSAGVGTTTSGYGCVDFMFQKAF